MKPITRSDLIESIVTEMERVWGPKGFGGELEAYAWLKDHFGISEEQDVQWQDVLSDWAGTLDEDTEDLDEGEKEHVKAFLQDDSAVTTFLEVLLQKYRNSNATYSG